MTNPTPLNVATDYFDALGRGDVPTLMGMLGTDVTWHQPGRNQFSGTHRGVDGVGRLLGGMMTASEGTFGLTVDGTMMVNGDQVAVPVRFAGRRDDASMDMSGVDLLTVVDGKIVAIHLFSADGEAEDAFWGAP
ncbi:nuclear transport factor 2 family protein [Rhodococcus sp. IEGM 1381]|uniref:nuclear transport factor 2 family protein n=1 Tax=Rhodococcus sp. IEGM 1381 TaxID=3047085 RepID=UPI0024B78DC9|nr:nuclear transport factor 2 family protein [Rhodococcus sp. IEGM 1381]MDI9894714.1 nuclear transport factor 2 family protein [Rhodococcus sp. IEGM 1381]